MNGEITERLLSRKFWVASAVAVAVAFVPDLDAQTKAYISSGVIAAYVVVQAIIDAFNGRIGGELVEGGLLAQVQERLISRKLWVSVVTGLAVAFQPDLSPEVKAQLVAGVGVVWFAAQGAVDLFRGTMGPGGAE